VPGGVGEVIEDVAGRAIDGNGAFGGWHMRFGLSCGPEPNRPVRKKRYP
jgi:hypothetical protein